MLPVWRPPSRRTPRAQASLHLPKPGTQFRPGLQLFAFDPNAQMTSPRIENDSESY